MRVLFAPIRMRAAIPARPSTGSWRSWTFMQRRSFRLHDSPGAASVPVPHDVSRPQAARCDRRRPPGGRDATRRTELCGRGNVVTWRNWRLRFGFNLREGLVLHQIGFNDNGRVRSILYRASLSEVLTAYGDPNQFWSWMLIFDEGCLGARTSGGSGSARPGGARQRDDARRRRARSGQAAVQRAACPTASISTSAMPAT